MKTVRNYLSVMLAFVLAFACACAAAEGANGSVRIAAQPTR